MSETWTVLSAVIPVFGIMVVGLIIRKLNWLTEEADQSLLRVNINLLLPCLILDSTLGNPALSRVGTVLLAPALGALTVSGGMLLAFALRGLAGLQEARAARTFAVATGIFNYGYVPIPLCLLLFGKDTVGVLCLFMVGVEMSLWTLGVMLMTGHRIGRDWRKIINGPLLAILMAMVLNTTGGQAHLPEAGRTTLHWLAQCAMPMALILIGAIVGDHIHEFHSAHGWRVIGLAIGLRMGLLPLCFLALARWCPMSMELQRVLVVEAAMGSAVFPIAMSKHYGGDPPTALRVVISTSVVGLVTIPLWIRFGLRFIGP
jgi:malate permease and related proteins